MPSDRDIEKAKSLEELVKIWHAGETDVTYALRFREGYTKFYLVDAREFYIAWARLQNIGNQHPFMNYSVSSHMGIVSRMNEPLQRPLKFAIAESIKGGRDIWGDGTNRALVAAGWVNPFNDGEYPHAISEKYGYEMPKPALIYDTSLPSPLQVTYNAKRPIKPTLPSRQIPIVLHESTELAELAQMMGLDINDFKPYEIIIPTTVVPWKQYGTQYPIGGGFLPKEGLVPAAIGYDNKLYLTKEGDLHYYLGEYYPDIPRVADGTKWKAIGFADENGYFLNRTEALIVAKRKKLININVKYGGQLDALDYNEARLLTPEEIIDRKVIETMGWEIQTPTDKGFKNDAKNPLNPELEKAAIKTKEQTNVILKQSTKIEASPRLPLSNFDELLNGAFHTRTGFDFRDKFEKFWAEWNLLLKKTFGPIYTKFGVPSDAGGTPLGKYVKYFLSKNKSYNDIHDLTLQLAPFKERAKALFIEATQLYEQGHISEDILKAIAPLINASNDAAPGSVGSILHLMGNLEGATLGNIDLFQLFVQMDEIMLSDRFAYTPREFANIVLKRPDLDNAKTFSELMTRFQNKIFDIPQLPNDFNTAALLFSDNDLKFAKEVFSNKKLVSILYAMGYDPLNALEGIGLKFLTDSEKQVIETIITELSAKVGNVTQAVTTSLPKHLSLFAAPKPKSGTYEIRSQFFEIESTILIKESNINLLERIRKGHYWIGYVDPKLFTEYLIKQGQHIANIEDEAGKILQDFFEKKHPIDQYPSIEFSKFKEYITTDGKHVVEGSFHIGEGNHRLALGKKFDKYVPFSFSSEEEFFAFMQAIGQKHLALPMYHIPDLEKVAFVRLYRVQPKVLKPWNENNWMKLTPEQLKEYGGEVGRLFGDNLEVLDQYGHGAPGYETFFIDIPKSDAVKYQRVHHTGKFNEYLLPRELADSKQLLSSATPIFGEAHIIPFSTQVVNPTLEVGVTVNIDAAANAARGDKFLKYLRNSINLGIIGFQIYDMLQPSVADIKNPMLVEKSNIERLNDADLLQYVKLTNEINLKQLNALELLSDSEMNKIWQSSFKDDTNDNEAKLKILEDITNNELVQLNIQIIKQHRADIKKLRDAYLEEIEYEKIMGSGRSLSREQIDTRNAIAALSDIDIETMKFNDVLFKNLYQAYDEINGNHRWALNANIERIHWLQHLLEFQRVNAQSLKSISDILQKYNEGFNTAKIEVTAIGDDGLVSYGLKDTKLVIDIDKVERFKREIAPYNITGFINIDRYLENSKDGQHYRNDLSSLLLKMRILQLDSQTSKDISSIPQLSQIFVSDFPIILDKFVTTFNRQQFDAFKYRIFSGIANIGLGFAGGPMWGVISLMGALGDIIGNYLELNSRNSKSPNAIYQPEITKESAQSNPALLALLDHKEISFDRLLTRREEYKKYLNLDLGEDLTDYQGNTWKDFDALNEFRRQLWSKRDALTQLTGSRYGFYQEDITNNRQGLTKEEILSLEKRGLIVSYLTHDADIQKQKEERVKTAMSHGKSILEKWFQSAQRQIQNQINNTAKIIQYNANIINKSVFIVSNIERPPINRVPVVADGLGVGVLPHGAFTSDPTLIKYLANNALNGDLSALNTLLKNGLAPTKFVEQVTNLVTSPNYIPLRAQTMSVDIHNPIQPVQPINLEDEAKKVGIKVNELTPLQRSIFVNDVLQKANSTAPHVSPLDNSSTYKTHLRDAEITQLHAQDALQRKSSAVVPVGEALKPQLKKGDPGYEAAAKAAWEKSTAIAQAASKASYDDWAKAHPAEAAKKEAESNNSYVARFIVENGKNLDKSISSIDVFIDQLYNIEYIKKSIKDILGLKPHQDPVGKDAKVKSYSGKAPLSVKDNESAKQNTAWINNNYKSYKDTSKQLESAQEKYNKLSDKEKNTSYGKTLSNEITALEQKYKEFIDTYNKGVEYATKLVNKAEDAEVAYARNPNNKDARDNYNEAVREAYQAYRVTYLNKASREIAKDSHLAEMRDLYGGGPGTAQGDKKGNGHSYGCTCSKCQKETADKKAAKIARDAVNAKLAEERKKADEAAKKAADNAKKAAEEATKKLKETEKSLPSDLKEISEAEGALDALDELIDTINGLLSLAGLDGANKGLLKDFLNKLNKLREKLLGLLKKLKNKPIQYSNQSFMMKAPFNAFNISPIVGSGMAFNIYNQTLNNQYIIANNNISITSMARGFNFKSHYKHYTNSSNYTFPSYGGLFVNPTPSSISSSILIMNQTDDEPPIPNNSIHFSGGVSLAAPGTHSSPDKDPGFRLVSSGKVVIPPPTGMPWNFPSGHQPTPDPFYIPSYMKQDFTTDITSRLLYPLSLV